MKSVVINRTKFTLGNLKELDGGVIDVAFMHELQNVLFDLANRPTLTKARKLTVTFELKPVPGAIMGQDGSQQGLELDQVEITGQVSSSVPKRQTRKYVMKPSNDKGKRNLLFHPDNLQDPDQATVMDIAGSEEE